MRLELWVPGEPVPQGSMRSPRAGVVLHNSKALMPWRDSIAWTAKSKWRGQALLDEPVNLTCEFYFAKPKKARTDVFRDTAPDLDKLIRAVGDALQGVVIVNDSRIVSVIAQKKWAGGVDKPGLRLTLGTRP